MRDSNQQQQTQIGYTESFDPNTGYMDIKLADLDLPKRFHTRLNRQKIFTVGDILSLSPDNYTKLIGRSSLASELKYGLEEMGWHVELDSQKHLEIMTQEAFDEVYKIRLEKEVMVLKDRLAKCEKVSRSKDATIEKLQKELKEAVKTNLKLSKKSAPRPTKSEKKLSEARKNEEKLNRSKMALEKELHHIKAVYEYKLESMKVWKNRLEADLAASRSLIKSQKAIIDRLQPEKGNNERIEDI